jgi:hypothetical protein
MVPALDIPRVRQLTLLVLVLAWVAVNFYAFMPGLMSPDSLSQYGQGLSGAYSNAHPPLMSFVLGLCARTFASPWPLLLLDLLMLAGGMALLAKDARPERFVWALLLVIVYLVLPPTWSLGVVLWKDSTLAGVLLLSVAALATRQFVVGGLLMIVAMLLRHNSIIAVAPMLFFVTGHVAKLSGSKLKRLGATLAAMVVMSTVPPAVERLSRAEDTCMLCMPAVLDLSAIYVERPDELQQSVFVNDVGVEDLKRTYTPSTMIFILHGQEPGVRHIAPGFVETHRREILREWARVIPRHPLIYVKSRLLFFKYLLGIGTAETFYAFHIGIDGNAWGLKLEHPDSGAHLWLRAQQDAARHALPFRGWFWFGLSTALTIVLFIRRRESLAFATAFSGFLFTFTLLLIAPSADFRYLFWTIVSCFATGALLLHKSEPVK